MSDDETADGCPFHDLHQWAWSCDPQGANRQGMKEHVKVRRMQDKVGIGLVSGMRLVLCLQRPTPSQSRLLTLQRSHCRHRQPRSPGTGPLGWQPMTRCWQSSALWVPAGPRQPPRKGISLRLARQKVKPRYKGRRRRKGSARATVHRSPAWTLQHTHQQRPACRQRCWHLQMLQQHRSPRLLLRPSADQATWRALAVGGQGKMCEGVGVASGLQ